MFMIIQDTGPSKREKRCWNNVTFTKIFNISQKLLVIFYFKNQTIIPFFMLIPNLKEFYILKLRFGKFKWASDLKKKHFFNKNLNIFKLTIVFVSGLGTKSCVFIRKYSLFPLIISPVIQNPLLSYLCIFNSNFVFKCLLPGLKYSYWPIQRCHGFYWVFRHFLEISQAEDVTRLHKITFL
jgi:hypothetical protein